MIIDKSKIFIQDNWIHVDGVGQIGLYSPFDKAILLDYSMKWIVGTNERISCTPSEIIDKVINLFKKND